MRRRLFFCGFVFAYVAVGLWLDYLNATPMYSHLAGFWNGLLFAMVYDEYVKDK